MTTPTAEQQDILAAAAEGHDLIKVSAGAGTGKTTTTMGVGRVPTWWEPGQQLYSTFGVAAGEDAGRKFADNPSVIVLRPGQLAARAAEPWQKRRLDAGKTRLKSADLAELIGMPDDWADKNTMMLSNAAWVGAMRETVLKFCTDDQPQIMARHAAWAGVHAPDRDRMVANAQWLWDVHLSREDGVVPYTLDHCKKHWSLKCPSYSYSRIMNDEAQDNNPCDLHVFKNQDAQFIPIGDTYQQLYEFRGSVDSLSDHALPGGLWLPLTGSFRFGPEIADVANMFLGKLEARFQLRGLGRPGNMDYRGRPDAVLCRTNAGCMKAAIGYLHLGLKVALAGKTRDELLYLARNAMALRNGRKTEHPALIGFRTWQEFCRYAETDPDGQDFLTLVRLVTAHGEQLVRWLESMTDGPADVTCATVWKAKGLEWGAVKLSDDFWPGEGGSFNAELAQWWTEGNRRDPFLRVGYVAVTRAQMCLDWDSLKWVEGF